MNEGWQLTKELKTGKPATNTSGERLYVRRLKQDGVEVAYYRWGEG